jgi:hypothetical protein
VVLLVTSSVREVLVQGEWIHTLRTCGRVSSKEVRVWPPLHRSLLESRALRECTSLLSEVFSPNHATLILKRFGPRTLNALLSGVRLPASSSEATQHGAWSSWLHSDQEDPLRWVEQVESESESD